jgi:multisubunit Na+/H+ antiporter MnhG subunit
MSDPAIDTIIFILLVLCIGFGAIGVIGLLLFPDIRSQMYTAFRASMISISTMIFAVVFFALSIFWSSGGDQYIILVLHTLVLLIIVAVSNGLVYKMILDRIKSTRTCQAAANKNKDNEKIP